MTPGTSCLASATPGRRAPLFAFLDERCVFAGQDQSHLWSAPVLFIHSAIRVHHGKTQVFIRGGVDTALPSEDQGVRILGTPLGHPDYVRAQLQSLLLNHQHPTLPLPWMLWLYCCSARANYACGLCTQSWLQVSQPTMTLPDADVSFNFWGLTPALCIGTWPVCLCLWVAWDSEASH